MKWGQYHGPTIRYHRETYVSGINLVSWHFKDQEEENVFTSEDKIAEEKMNLAIEDHLQQHINENRGKFEQQAKKYAENSY